MRENAPGQPLINDGAQRQNHVGALRVWAHAGRNTTGPMLRAPRVSTLVGMPQLNTNKRKLNLDPHAGAFGGPRGLRGTCDPGGSQMSRSGYWELSSGRAQGAVLGNSCFQNIICLRQRTGRVNAHPTEIPSRPTQPQCLGLFIKSEHMIGTRKVSHSQHARRLHRGTWPAARSVSSGRDEPQFEPHLPGHKPHCAWVPTPVGRNSLDAAGADGRGALVS